MTHRVVLVDDQELVRAGLRVLLTETPDLVVVGEAANGREAVKVVQEVRPDVVVMDLRMPDVDGIEATRQLTSGSDPARVLVLTTYDDDEYVYAALRAGASGFVVKDMALEDILAAIRIVADGDALIAPSVTRRLIEEFVGQSGATSTPGPDLATGAEPVPAVASVAASAAAPGPPPSLRRPPHGVTEREEEVLVLVGRGMTNGEIAEHLNISHATVKAHVGSLLSKLHARDRMQLLIIAYESGLVLPNGS